MRKTGLLKKGISMMLSITFILCLTLVILLVMFYQNAKESSVRYAKRTHDRVMWEITEDLSVLENTIGMVAFAQSVQDVLQDTKQLHGILYYVRQLRETFSNAFTYSPYIEGITLYDAKRQYLLSSGDAFWVDNELGEEWQDITGVTYSGAQYTKEGENTGKIYLLFPVYQKTAGKMVSSSRIGYLCFTLTNKMMDMRIEQGMRDAGIDMEILDGEGCAICVRNVAGKKCASHLAVFENNVGRTGWQLCSTLTSYELSSDMRPMLIVACGIGTLGVLLFIRMLCYYKNEIRRPLLKIQEFMTCVPDIHARILIDTDEKNELLDMMQMLNEMLGTLEHKNEELVQSQTQMLEEKTVRQQMELVAYRNQINPHFLYNTLDCVRGIALKYRAQEIAEITESLSHMFRYTVKGGDSATIGQEINYVQDYAKIITYRFADRISIEIEPNEALFRYRVIRLLLQPLVENAVIHGLERCMKPGRVYVSMQKQADERILFRVEDNGLGIPGERLRQLEEQIQKAKEPETDVPALQSHVGLFNIAKRLYLQYGSEASLRIDSREQVGTVIEILLPVNGEGEKEYV